MSGATDRWTAERVRALPDDGNRYELIGGELIVTPAPKRRHQIVARALLRLLDPWLQQTGAGEILWSPADLSLGEDEVLQPDLFVYRRPNDPAAEWRDITDLLLVIEVLSPGTARHDRGLKRRRYQRARVPEYWIVDPDARLIERWRPDDVRPEIATERLVWEPVAGLSPLEVDVEVLFGVLP